MAIRTSDTHPIEIGWLAPGTGWGRIGMTLCPGKKQIGAMTGSWERDLSTDLDDIRNWGAKLVVAAITDAELSELGVENIRDEFAMRGIKWLQLIVPDGGTIGPDTEREWANVSREILENMSHGESVLFHCKGGLGRTGMLAARFLSQNGLEPYQAIGKVREARTGTVETIAQEQSVHDSADSDGPFVAGVSQLGTWSRISEPDMLDRFRGCLLGGAVGDALGAAVEFDSIDGIRRHFGPGGIRDFSEAYGRVGAVTDDSQMTMFTAEGCIRSFTRWLNRGLSSPRDVIKHAYGRWLVTQGGRPANASEFFDRHALNGWLIDVPELHNRRAPGITCEGALERGEPVEDSKGCGGVMRVAPIGLFGATGQFNGSVFELGSKAVQITHGHPSGYLAGGAMAEIILQIFRGASVRDAVDIAINQLSALDDSYEVSSALKGALHLADTQGADADAIPELGKGWIAEEALAIGVYAVLAADTFEEAIVLAVNHSGDSDSTGSIAGQILGARLGVQAIPQRWLSELELRNEIQHLASDLHGMCYYRVESQPPSAFIDRYPGT